MAAGDQGFPAEINLRWVHRGGSFDELLKARPEEAPLHPAAPDEVIARVEAASICSSDIKMVRMGANHPLFAKSGSDMILGHEVSLRVHDVGSRQAHRFHKGQRIGLQPRMQVEGKRQIIGFDLPGGFAQYLRLGPAALADYVFDVPETLTAAEIALLEPYGCVERAYKPSARQDFDPQGSALIVLGPDSARYSASRSLRWAKIVVSGDPQAPLPGFLHAMDMQRASLAELAGQHFDDILALGELDAEQLSQLPPLLAEGGLLLQARQRSTGPIPLDAARVHYDALSFIGTTASDICEALAPARQRFDVKAGGTALVYGAGGAMGRIHVHRLLQLEAGPRQIIATSRKGKRLTDLEMDFGPLAAERGIGLCITDPDRLASIVAKLAPGGLDDVIVVAPDNEAVATTAQWLAPDGLLAVFAGFPYGKLIPFDLSGVAVTGKRLTGSTGCTVGDMQDVLSRVVAGSLDLSVNLKAVAGLNALPQALDAVNRGTVSGKIVVYPQAPNLPLQLVNDAWRPRDELELTGPV